MKHNIALNPPAVVQIAMTEAEFSPLAGSILLVITDEVFDPALYPGESSRPASDYVAQGQGLAGGNDTGYPR